ncbi:MAG TPA: SRPBCC domain-containing protein [Rhizomicrobium sp.]|jgi:uncharacterized protein YndB with AHSA1/START domain
MMRRTTNIYSALLALGLVWPVQASATIVDAGAAGFTVEETVDIPAPPDQVYQALVTPSRWWSSDHTYSHDAANLSLDPKAGGCWCETLAGGGSVQHMTVVNAIPRKMLRLRGALGPLQSMAVDGAMTITLNADGKITHLTLIYTVGGYAKGGFTNISKAVDRVLGEQTERLRLLLETGSPTNSSQPQTKE